MKRDKKIIKVSCDECIYIKRLITCSQNGKDCCDCKNACCCRKCSPDISGKAMDSDTKTYFSAGMPLAVFAQKKLYPQKQESAEKKTVAPDKKIVETNREKKKEKLHSDENGQLSFNWS